MRFPFTPILLNLVSFLLLSLSCPSHAAVVTSDTVWKGEVTLTEDCLVPSGVTLTIAPGTVVRINHAESTKTDPEYVSPLTEITIRGHLKIEGTKGAPVKFIGATGKAGSWAGIIVDQGTAVVSEVHIYHAETAILVLKGAVEIRDSLLRDNRYALLAQGSDTDVLLENTRITDNDYGVFSLQGARLKTANTVVAGNRKRDVYSAAPKRYDSAIPKRGIVHDVPVGRRYRDEVFRGDTIWQGRIEVAGTVRVPEGSRLIILPGTVVEFTRRDTNGDGIGENGLLIQGRLIAKGTNEKPIVFRSAEKNKAMGDWDAINIMNSASGQNVVEYCLIEHAYRGLHFHFSNVAVTNTVISHSYRGIQFQESLVQMRTNYLHGNKSGVQGRDSDVVFTDNTLSGNYIGANFFRVNLVAKGNRIVDNLKEGLRIREGVSSLHENRIDGNRQGLMAADMSRADISQNSISGNMEAGISLRNVDNVEVRGNVISSNGITGLGILDSRAVIRGNLVSDNGERGIGVQSFDGSITENNFSSNGRYAVDLDGSKDVSAPDNWWGTADVEKVILDKLDDPARGRVLHKDARQTPFRFEWPLKTISRDAVWRGVVSAAKTVTLLPGAVLTVAPGTRVEFSKGAGLTIKGMITARGTTDNRIIFTSADRKGPSDWDEILLEYAAGSALSHCVIEYGTWGVHSHFTDLSLANCVIRNNEGGMRFRSGPVEIRDSLFENNSIGIRAYLGNGVIRGNSIRKNDIGIFVREKGGGLRISGNNLYDNGSYNIRVGDFNNEDVPAGENWWGGLDPLQTIFDGRNEPGIGNVLYEPYLKEPLSLGQGALQ